MNNTKNRLINNRINIIYASLILLIFIKWIIRQITIYRFDQKIKILRLAIRPGYLYGIFDIDLW